MTQRPSDQTFQQYLTFVVAGEEYAIRILAVREILTYGDITAVPKAPAWMRGVINVRGSVVPVVDLAMKLGFEATAPASVTRIIIVEAIVAGEMTTIGLIAAAVNQVIDLSASDIEPPPSLGTHIDTTNLIGVARTGGAKFVLLLDIDAVLTRIEASNVAEAAEGTEAESLDANGAGHVEREEAETAAAGTA